VENGEGFTGTKGERGAGKFVFDDTGFID